MDDTEAKLRLSACRPGGLDADDPNIREALLELGRSPALNTWFEQQQRFDGEMAKHLRSLSVPEKLQTEILAAAKLSRPAPSRWVHSRWVTAAAAVMLAAIMTGVFFRPASRATLATYSGDIAAMFAAMKDQGFGLDESSPEVSHLNAYLVNHEAPPATTLQAGLQRAATPLGCHIVEWRGRKVSMICFAKDGDEAHLFVIDRDAISDFQLAFASPQRPQVVMGYPLTTWVDARHAYVLVGNSPETDLTKFL